jgi:iron complex outermembrane receptor protein
MPIRYRARASLVLFTVAAAFPAHAHMLEPEKSGPIETVVVTGERKEGALPNSVERVTADAAKATINIVNTEDMLKYVPSIMVRKRHYGDTQDPIATRTSGVGASARSLIYVDGILVSSPIGNNNSTASPHFAVASPEDVSAIDVLYGPFAAEYAGNSIGAVVNITTEMPSRFEIYADTLGAVQTFSQYGTHNTYGTWQLTGGMGDRAGRFSWRLSANHLDTLGEPLSYVTLSRPPSTSSGGVAVTGGFDGLNRAGSAIVIVGAGGIEHQVQDTATLKFSYDLPDDIEISYIASVFHQTDHAAAQSYLSDASGMPIYSGNVNFEDRDYEITAGSFSRTVYRWRQTHLAQAISFKSAPAGDFQWEIVGTDYAYLSDNRGVPSTALPFAQAGGSGTITRMDGTGWYTLDAKAIWRGWAGNEFSFGAHRDAETFIQTTFATANWIGNSTDAVNTQAKGRTATNAVWAQDVLAFAPDWKATLGGRYENWHAYDGVNISASPPLDQIQPALSGNFFSPKLSLSWQPAQSWTIDASYGSAYRMPTVTELYQAITTGAQLSVPNPDLKPEHADSFELAAEHATQDGRIRLSLFRESIRDALLSQSAPLVAESTALYSYVQNVGRTRVRGFELVVDRKNAIVAGLELSGSLTYADGRILNDPVYPTAEGKRIPQLPPWRASAMATYRPGDRFAFTVAARYSDRSYGTIDNSDPIGQTFQGFGSYFVMDVRAQYRVDQNWTASFGVDNLNNAEYFLYHPFPQRTFVMEIHYAQ